MTSQQGPPEISIRLTLGYLTVKIGGNVPGAKYVFLSRVKKIIMRDVLYAHRAIEQKVNVVWGGIVLK